MKRLFFTVAVLMAVLAVQAQSGGGQGGFGGPGGQGDGPGGGPGGNTKSSSDGTGNLILETDSSWAVTGTVLKDSYAKALNVIVGRGVTWVLTADTDVDALVNNGRIVLNGHKLTYKTLSGSDPEAVTAISTVSATSAENVGFYGLDGRFAGTSFSSLPHGIYVCGGKKYIKRLF